MLPKKWKISRINNDSFRLSERVDCHLQSTVHIVEYSRARIQFRERKMLDKRRSEETSDEEELNGETADASFFPHCL